MSNAITLPNVEILKTDTAQDLKDSVEAAEFVDAIMVSSNDNLKSATRILAEIKTKHKEIEAKRKNITNPLNKAQKELNEFFKPALDALKKAEGQIKQKVANCIEERLETRDAILNEIADAPEEKRDALLARSDELVPPKIEGLSIVTQWFGDLESNQEAVQWAIANKREDLLTIDTASLMAITKAYNEDPKIPGWKAFKKSVVRITTGKVT